MNVKQIGIYLILAGVAVFLLYFLGKIIGFIGNNPILGIAFIAILAGVGMLVYNLLQEQKEDKDKESIRGIEK